MFMRRTLTHRQTIRFLNYSTSNPIESARPSNPRKWLDPSREGRNSSDKWHSKELGFSGKRATGSSGHDYELVPVEEQSRVVSPLCIPQDGCTRMTVVLDSPRFRAVSGRYSP